MTYSDLTTLAIALGLLVLGAGIGFFLSGSARRSAVAKAEQAAKDQLDKMLSGEERQRRMELLEEKDGWYAAKAEQEKELDAQRAKVKKEEKNLQDERGSLQTQRDSLEKDQQRFRQQESRVVQREKAAKSREDELAQKIGEYQERLEVID